MDYLLLVLLWMVWCAVHSFLISLTVTEFLRRRFESVFRYYRIFFNVFSTVTLVPVLFYSYSLRGAPIVTWSGPWRMVPIVLWAVALFFFAAGARRYDLLQFLGVRQIKDPSACSVLTEDCTLDTDGVLALVRHPWYTGVLLVVWARPLDLAAICTSSVISGYLLVGTILEERKLVALFGRQYTDYQQRVSMLFPFKWLRERFLGNR